MAFLQLEFRHPQLRCWLPAGHPLLPSTFHDSCSSQNGMQRVPTDCSCLRTRHSTSSASQSNSEVCGGCSSLQKIRSPGCGGDGSGAERFSSRSQCSCTLLPLPDAASLIDLDSLPCGTTLVFGRKSVSATSFPHARTPSQQHIPSAAGTTATELSQAVTTEANIAKAAEPYIKLPDKCREKELKCTLWTPKVTQEGSGTQCRFSEEEMGRNEKSPLTIVMFSDKVSHCVPAGDHWTTTSRVATPVNISAPASGCLPVHSSINEPQVTAPGDLCSVHSKNSVCSGSSPTRRQGVSNVYKSKYTDCEEKCSTTAGSNACGSVAAPSKVSSRSSNRRADSNKNRDSSSRSSSDGSGISCTEKLFFTDDTTGRYIATTGNTERELLVYMPSTHPLLSRRHFCITRQLKLPRRSNQQLHSKENQQQQQQHQKLDLQTQQQEAEFGEHGTSSPPDNTLSPSRTVFIVTAKASSRISESGRWGVRGLLLLNTTATSSISKDLRGRQQALPPAVRAAVAAAAVAADSPFQAEEASLPGCCNDVAYANSNSSNNDLSSTCRKRYTRTLPKNNAFQVSPSDHETYSSSSSPTHLISYRSKDYPCSRRIHTPSSVITGGTPNYSTKRRSVKQSSVSNYTHRNGHGHYQSRYSSRNNSSTYNSNIYNSSEHSSNLHSSKTLSSDHDSKSEHSSGILSSSSRICSSSSDRSTFNHTACDVSKSSSTTNSEYNGSEKWGLNSRASRTCDDPSLPLELEGFQCGTGKKKDGAIAAATFQVFLEGHQHSGGGEEETLVAAAERIESEEGEAEDTTRMPFLPATETAVRHAIMFTHFVYEPHELHDGDELYIPIDDALLLQQLQQKNTCTHSERRRTGSFSAHSYDKTAAAVCCRDDGGDCAAASTSSSPSTIHRQHRYETFKNSCSSSTRGSTEDSPSSRDENSSSNERSSSSTNISNNSKKHGSSTVNCNSDANRSRNDNSNSHESSSSSNKNSGNKENKSESQTSRCESSSHITSKCWSTLGSNASKANSDQAWSSSTELHPLVEVINDSTHKNKNTFETKRYEVHGNSSIASCHQDSTSCCHACGMRTPLFCFRYVFRRSRNPDSPVSSESTATECRTNTAAALRSRLGGNDESAFGDIYGISEASNTIAAAEMHIAARSTTATPGAATTQTAAIPSELGAAPSATAARPRLSTATVTTSAAATATAAGVTRTRATQAVRTPTAATTATPRARTPEGSTPEAATPTTTSLATSRALDSGTKNVSAFKIASPTVTRPADEIVVRRKESDSLEGTVRRGDMRFRRKTEKISAEERETMEIATGHVTKDNRKEEEHKEECRDLCMGDTCSNPTARFGHFEEEGEEAGGFSFSPATQESVCSVATVVLGDRKEKTCDHKCSPQEGDFTPAAAAVKIGQECQQRSATKKTADIFIDMSISSATESNSSSFSTSSTSSLSSSSSTSRHVSDASELSFSSSSFFAARKNVANSPAPGTASTTAVSSLLFPAASGSSIAHASSPVPAAVSTPASPLSFTVALEHSSAQCHQKQQQRQRREHQQHHQQHQHQHRSTLHRESVAAVAPDCRGAKAATARGENPATSADIRVSSRCGAASCSLPAVFASLAVHSGAGKTPGAIEPQVRSRYFQPPLDDTDLHLHQNTEEEEATTTIKDLDEWSCARTRTHSEESATVKQSASRGVSEGRKSRYFKSNSIALGGGTCIINSSTGSSNNNKGNDSRDSSRLGKSSARKSSTCNSSTSTSSTSTSCTSTSSTGGSSSNRGNSTSYRGNSSRGCQIVTDRVDVFLKSLPSSSSINPLFSTSQMQGTPSTTIHKSASSTSSTTNNDNENNRAYSTNCIKYSKADTYIEPNPSSSSAVHPLGSLPFSHMVELKTVHDRRETCSLKGTATSIADGAWNVRPAAAAATAEKQDNLVDKQVYSPVCFGQHSKREQNCQSFSRTRLLPAGVRTPQRRMSSLLSSHRERSRSAGSSREESGCSNTTNSCGVIAAVCSTPYAVKIRTTNTEELQDTSNVSRVKSNVKLRNIRLPGEKSPQELRTDTNSNGEKNIFEEPRKNMTNNVETITNELERKHNPGEKNSQQLANVYIERKKNNEEQRTINRDGEENAEELRTNSIHEKQNISELQNVNTSEEKNTEELRHIYIIHGHRRQKDQEQPRNDHHSKNRGAKNSEELRNLNDSEENNLGKLRDAARSEKRNTGERRDSNSHWGTQNNELLRNAKNRWVENPGELGSSNVRVLKSSEELGSINCDKDNKNETENKSSSTGLWWRDICGRRCFAADVSGVRTPGNRSRNSNTSSSNDSSNHGNTGRYSSSPFSIITSPISHSQSHLRTPTFSRRADISTSHAAAVAANSVRHHASPAAAPAVAVSSLPPSLGGSACCSVSLRDSHTYVSSAAALPEATDESEAIDDIVDILENADFKRKSRRSLQGAINASRPSPFLSRQRFHQEEHPTGGRGQEIRQQQWQYSKEEEQLCQQQQYRGQQQQEQQRQQQSGQQLCSRQQQQSQQQRGGAGGQRQQLHPSQREHQEQQQQQCQQQQYQEQQQHHHQKERQQQRGQQQPQQRGQQQPQQRGQQQPQQRGQQQPQRQEQQQHQTHRQHPVQQQQQPLEQQGYEQQQHQESRQQPSRAQHQQQQLQQQQRYPAHAPLLPSEQPQACSGWWSTERQRALTRNSNSVRLPFTPSRQAEQQSHERQQQGTTVQEQQQHHHQQQHHQQQHPLRHQQQHQEQQQQQSQQQHMRNYAAASDVGVEAVETRNAATREQALLANTEDEEILAVEEILDAITAAPEDGEVLRHPKEHSFSVQQRSQNRVSLPGQQQLQQQHAESCIMPSFCREERKRNTTKEEERYAKDSEDKSASQYICTAGECCAICKEELMLQQEIAALPACSHFFCFLCIVKWACCVKKRRGPPCPLCKQTFSSLRRFVRYNTSPVQEKEHQSSKEEDSAFNAGVLDAQTSAFLLSGSSTQRRISCVTDSSRGNNVSECGTSSSSTSHPRSSNEHPSSTENPVNNQENSNSTNNAGSSLEGSMGTSGTGSCRRDSATGETSLSNCLSSSSNYSNTGNLSSNGRVSETWQKDVKFRFVEEASVGTLIAEKRRSGVRGAGEEGGEEEWHSGERDTSADIMLLSSQTSSSTSENAAGAGGCQICGEDTDWNSMLLCDQCDEGFHLYCLSPPLECVPTGRWYCPRCCLNTPAATNASARRAAVARAAAAAAARAERRSQRRRIGRDRTGRDDSNMTQGHQGEQQSNERYYTQRRGQRQPHQQRQQQQRPQQQQQRHQQQLQEHRPLPQGSRREIRRRREERERLQGRSSSHNRAVSEERDYNDTHSRELQSQSSGEEPVHNSHRSSHGIREWSSSIGRHGWLEQFLYRHPPRATTRTAQTSPGIATSTVANEATPTAESAVPVPTRSSPVYADHERTATQAASTVAGVRSTRGACALTRHALIDEQSERESAESSREYFQQKRRRVICASERENARPIQTEAAAKECRSSEAQQPQQQQGRRYPFDRLAHSSSDTSDNEARMIGNEDRDSDSNDSSSSSTVSVRSEHGECASPSRRAANERRDAPDESRHNGRQRKELNQNRGESDEKSDEYDLDGFVASDRDPLVPASDTSSDSDSYEECTSARSSSSRDSKSDSSTSGDSGDGTSRQRRASSCRGRGGQPRRRGRQMSNNGSRRSTYTTNSNRGRGRARPYRQILVERQQARRFVRCSGGNGGMSNGNTIKSGGAGANASTTRTVSVASGLPHVPLRAGLSRQRTVRSVAARALTYLQSSRNLQQQPLLAMLQSQELRKQQQRQLLTSRRS